MNSPLCTSCGGDFCGRTTEVLSERDGDVLRECNGDILPLKPDVSRKSIV
jgi:hypothetical protein